MFHSFPFCLVSNMKVHVYDEHQCLSPPRHLLYLFLRLDSCKSRQNMILLTGKYKKEVDRYGMGETLFRSVGNQFYSLGTDYRRFTA